MIIPKIIAYFLVISLFLPLLYLAVITLASYLFRKKTAAGSSPLKMGVLIPAPNQGH